MEIDLFLISLKPCALSSKARELWESFEPNKRQNCKIIKKEFTVYQTKDLSVPGLGIEAGVLDHVPAVVKIVKGKKSSAFIIFSKNIFTPDQQELNPKIKDWAVEPVYIVKNSII